MNRPVIAAVIGCGNISKYHFSGLSKAGAKIKYVCDLNPNAAEPWRRQFDALYTADYRDILHDPEVNTVTITTFSGLHAAIALAAIAAGKAVICEKTLALNAADSHGIVAAAEAAGTIFYTSYMKRFIPAVEKAKELLPELGSLVNGYFKGYQNWGDFIDDGDATLAAWGFKPGETTWIKRNLGGGILTCGGSHLLDLVGHFFGRPHRVFATMRQPAGMDFEVQATALFETAACPVFFDVMAHALHRVGFLRDGWEEEVTITGTRGRLQIFSAQWDDPEHKASLLRYHDSRNGTETEFRFAPESPFDRAVAFYCRNIAAGEQGAQSRLTGYDVDQLIESMTASARSGAAVTIPWQ